MTDSNDDLDNPSEDFEEAFEVQDGNGASDFEPLEVLRPNPSVRKNPSSSPGDEDPLDDLELALGAELDQIVRKQEFTIGGDDEYDSIESESVASAPSGLPKRKKPAACPRAPSALGSRRLAEREEAAAQEEEEPPPQRQRRRAPPRQEVDEQRREQSSAQSSTKRNRHEPTNRHRFLMMMTNGQNASTAMAKGYELPSP